MGRQGNPGGSGASAVRRAGSLAPFLLIVLPISPGISAEPERGFQMEQRVRESTRLDWEFAAGAGARLSSQYDSRQQRYQLFAPPTYKASRTWPLVVFVSPGDDPLGWRALRKPCEDADWLFAAAYGAGNASPPAQRVRTVLDVLDDVRRHYRVDPDRTYLAGFGSGAAVAARIAFALPELFGGVICLSGDAPLPELDHLRRRAAERLSVALVVGGDDRVRARQEKYLAPLLRDLGVRSRLWLAPGRDLPSAATLAQVQGWLETDLKRRQTDRRDQIGMEENPSRRTLAAHALEQARKELREPGRLHQGAARLDWLVKRWRRTEAAEQAVGLLADLRADADRGRALAAQEAARRRTFLTAQARALEQLGQLEAARQAWEGVARLADADERKKAIGEGQRLAALLARKAYLGATFAGDTTQIKAVAPGGPAYRAGLRAGDLLLKVGVVKVATLEELREQVRTVRPGDNLRLTLRRDDREMAFVVKVGAPPREEAPSP